MAQDKRSEKPGQFKKEAKLASFNGAVSAVVSYILGNVIPILWGAASTAAIASVAWLLGVPPAFQSHNVNATASTAIQKPQEKDSEVALYESAKIVVVDVKKGVNTFTDPPVVVTVTPPGPAYKTVLGVNGAGRIPVFDTFRVEWNKDGTLLPILDTREAAVGGGSGVFSDSEKKCLFKFDWLTSNDLTDDNENTPEEKRKRSLVLIINNQDYPGAPKRCNFP